jgi:hypothetical protein
MSSLSHHKINSHFVLASYCLSFIPKYNFQQPFKINYYVLNVASKPTQDICMKKFKHKYVLYEIRLDNSSFTQEQTAIPYICWEIKAVQSAKNIYKAPDGVHRKCGIFRTLGLL